MTENGNYILVIQKHGPPSLGFQAKAATGDLIQDDSVVQRQRGSASVSPNPAV